DAELVSLRDQISSARTEDIPPLLEQMERLQALAARQTESEESTVEPRSPYFGRMLLRERDKEREILIGRGTYLDTKAGIRIVDWRDAPVSRLYYRYSEGDDYDEVFGDREVTGEVVTRRAVTITDKTLRRIQCPQGNFAHSKKHGWIRLDDSQVRLTGGQGTAARAERGSGKLGVGDAITENEDKHLREITPLIDARQFELITQPDSGLVVIQGGAGSGKTTIGLHRLAYLTFHDPKRFRPDRMLVVVFNEALVRYISQVLPSLGLHGVSIRTYQEWAARLRASALHRLPRLYSDETPGVVTRLKKHPVMLQLLEEFLARRAKDFSARLAPSLERDPNLEGPLTTFERSAERPFAHRLHAIRGWIDDHHEAIEPGARNTVLREVERELARFEDITHVWAELLTDLPLLKDTFGRLAPGQFLPQDLERAHSWMNRQCSRVLTELEEKLERAAERADAAEAAEARPSRRERDADEESVPNEDRRDDEDDYRAVDGLDLEDRATLDREDDALLLRLLQRIKGPLRRGQVNKEPLGYEHVLIDEAQDLSPVEMSVIFATVSRGQSITLAGDTAQRLHMDNGFTDWKTVLGELGLAHVEVEPLQLSYRSTAEILQVAQHVLGHLRPVDPPQATRHGAPVELFQLAETGDAVAFLGEALRELAIAEPRASVAVVARYPEQAQIYFEGLRRADVPYLRHITDQDFPFKPGVDVTDIRQVKGLEFDYVILVEVTEASYPEEDDARHLLHIGVTRAAHQLWLLSSGRPSRLLPDELRDRGY
ncbi:MAG TPA: ATP-binding domain-containing protein, partial [Polyangiaceae bacterium]|nr:ATP-binding domain-containing protein [Polyangiaceae bacterium]